MPFRQLKSFLKILIGVQYHCIAIHPGMPAEYPQKRQSFRLHRCFRCGWPLMCGRQDSIILRCEFHRAGIQQQSTGLLHLHGFESAAVSGAGDRTRLHYGASGVEPPGGNSPPDCCIFMGSSPSLFPVRATGLEYTMEHPASSRRMATVHRTVAFTWVRVLPLFPHQK